MDERIKQNASYFDSLINLIPARFYLVNSLTSADEVADIMPSLNQKYLHHTKKPSLEEVKQIKKQKRREKVDPDAFQSTTDMQTARASQPAVETDDVQNDTTDASSPPKSHSSSSESPREPGDLKKRLQARIAELQQRRLPSGSNAGSAPNSPTLTKSRTQILEERKKQKQARKQKRRDEAKTISMAGTKRAHESNNESKNASEAIRFNQIEVDHTANGQKKRKLDPKQALARAESKQARLQKLKEKDSEKAGQIEEANKWNKMLKQASGEKVLDNPSLLKKSIKKIEKKKQKSAKVWNERVQNVKDKQVEKQRKRTENIQKRKEEVKAKKMGKKVQKSKSAGAKPKKRAGFEGK